MSGLGCSGLVGFLEGHNVVPVINESAKEETTAVSPPHTIHVV
jgi:hypothetical protein